MVNTYQLVNPQIDGKFKSKIKAQNSKEAANKFYKSLSEHFNNSVPRFYFSIQKGSSGNGKYYHFKVKEQRNNNAVNFNVTPFQLTNEQESINKFENRLNQFKAKQAGGKKNKKKSKKHDSSESDSDSSDSEYLLKRSKSYVLNSEPFSYWWYDPYLYDITSVYVPTFYSYATPYVQLALFP